MTERYYIDTSIWMDFLENRADFSGKPIGDIAWRLFSLLKERQDNILVSDLVMAELLTYYDVSRFRLIFTYLEPITIRILSNEIQKKEATAIAEEREVPFSDALHAILARDHYSVLITRDKHFKVMIDVVSSLKPEEIL